MLPLVTTMLCCSTSLHHNKLWMCNSFHCVQLLGATGQDTDVAEAEGRQSHGGEQSVEGTIWECWYGWALYRNSLVDVHILFLCDTNSILGMWLEEDSDVHLCTYHTCKPLTQVHTHTYLNLNLKKPSTGRCFPAGRQIVSPHNKEN